VAQASAAPAFDRAPVPATLRAADGPGRRLNEADDNGTATDAKTGLRMKDLTRETGLTRETIHFYITQGLLPPGTKTGRNTAEYGPEHLFRLQRIRDLQARHFLPLRAIKALLEDELASENLTPQQEELLARVRVTLPDLGRERGKTVALADAAGRRLPEDEIAQLREAGIIEGTGRGASARVSADDAEILRGWADARDAGTGPERGFQAVDLALYDNAVKRLVRAEVKRFSQAYADRPTSEATEVLQKVLPLVDRLLTAMHQRHLHRVLADGTPPGED
jgi:DNA-binding transcriptional MerR regulator